MLSAFQKELVPLTCNGMDINNMTKIYFLVTCVYSLITQHTSTLLPGFLFSSCLLQESDQFPQLTEASTKFLISLTVCCQLRECGPH